MALIDVILVNWNDRENAIAALESVLALPEVAHDADYAAITVSDNGSQDGSVTALQARFGSRVTIIENGANLGFGAAVNRALARTVAPFVFLLNPDATVRPGALHALVHFMQDHPKCAIAGPKIFEGDGRVAQSCGEFDTWAGAFLRSSAWGEWPPFARYANGAALRRFDYNSPRKVDLVIGAAMLIRRSVLNEIGVFDERFFLYHEEIDLAKRVADAGYESWFVPQAQATHIGQQSSRGRNVEPQKQRSRRLYWDKHFGGWFYYTLSAALVGRYVLYLAIVLAASLAVRNLLRR